jgi:hypothetical protein
LTSLSQLTENTVMVSSLPAKKQKNDFLSPLASHISFPGFAPKTAI